MTITILSKLLPKILSILKVHFQDKLDFNQIRANIRHILPNNLGVVKGKIKIKSGEESDFFEIIIHNNLEMLTTNKNENKILFENVLTVIEFVNQNAILLKDYLEKFKSLKKQFKNSFRNLQEVLDKKLKYSRDPANLFTKESQFPYLLVYIGQFGNAEVNQEEIFTKLRQLTIKYDFHYLPDEIVLENQNIWFLNPLLFKSKLTGYEIGWSYYKLPNYFQLCHICRKRIYRTHFFYSQLCQGCGDLNYLKRNKTADLTGRIALVSGARVKIGYHVGLRLLRAGARLIALTRFPHDAALRYAQEPDFNQWKNKLNIFGLDFRDLKNAIAFIQFLLNNYSHLDILINNAAQTVRHPPIYYKHLLPNERKSINQLPESIRPLLSLKEEFQNVDAPPLLGNKKNDFMNIITHNFQKSAELSQIPLNKEDIIDYGEIFPKGEYDQYGEQIDLRDYNTWVTPMDEVSIPEILEVQLINQIVPTLFVSKLKPMLLRSPNQFKYIVNVSSIEGQFSFNKEGRHPHTCIAKAALNMLTFSIAEDYAYDRIFVTSTDPGWVTEQFPLRGKNSKVRNFALDLEDAAARVCDPIFTGVNERKFWRRRFFKHYRATKW